MSEDNKLKEIAQKIDNEIILRLKTGERTMSDGELEYLMFKEQVGLFRRSYNAQR